VGGIPGVQVPARTAFRAGNRPNSLADESSTKLSHLSRGTGTLGAFTKDMKTCPYCAEEIQPAAKICRFCQRDLVTGQSTLQAVPVAAEPSRGVAAVLSLIIPGAGQMYKGQVGKGFAFLFFTAIGYVIFIIPGLFLHIIAVGDAAQEQRAKGPQIELPPLTPEERRRRAVLFRRGVAIVLGTVVLSVALGILLQDRPQAERATSTGTQKTTTIAGDTVYLDAKDWPTTSSVTFIEIPFRPLQPKI
jgi:TM2 domain-containing membrane protein YozV